MDTAQWPQEIVVKPMEEIIVVPNNINSSTKQAAASSLSDQRRAINRPQKDQQVLNCPRCNSTNTKFCYYNNYSLSQPRYFCKTCRRYWTEGGSLRNIPVGGGSRKNNKRSSNSSSTSNVSSNSSNPSSKKLPDLVNSQNPNSHKIHQGQDLNLGFPSHDFKTISELIQVPNFDSHNSTNKGLSALELLNGISATASRGLSSFMPMPMPDPNSIYSSGFSLQEFKPSTLSFSLDGLGSAGGYGGLHGVQETTGGRLLFPFEDLKQVSGSSDMEQNREHGDSTGYWNGVLGGGSW